MNAVYQKICWATLPWLECGERLIEVVARRSRRRELAKPLVPLADGVDRGRAVGGTAALDRGADRIARAGLHADAPLIDRAAVGQALGAGARHREPGVRHAPAEIGRALAVVHMTVDPHAVDFLDVDGEELGDVLIGRPVDRHAEFVLVDFLELRLELGPLEPVVAEPVEIGELLIGQLVELAVRTRGERLAHEVVDVEHRVGDVLALAGHPVGQVDRKLKARMGADQVGVIDIGVVQIALGLHLRLHGLDHLALAQELVVDLDAGDLFERLGKCLGFILVGRNGLRQHVDFHALERFGCLDEPFHFLLLVFLGESRGLEFGIDPFFRLVHPGKSGRRKRQHSRGRNGGQYSTFH